MLKVGEWKAWGSTRTGLKAYFWIGLLTWFYIVQVLPSWDNSWFILPLGWIIWISVQWFVQSRVNAEVHCTVDDYGSFIADPKACEKFYFCDHTGAATSVYCPQGMWFNTKKGICDLPSNVNCVIQDDDNSPFDEEPVDCPTHDTTFVTFLPSKVNCRHYYLCYHGRAFKQECITELHWNPKKNRCDFPSKAKCSVSGVLV